MQTATQTTLFRARLLLEEGRTSAALTVLDTIEPQQEKERHDIAYLRGWGYIQNRQWTDATDALSPFMKLVQGEDLDQEPVAERERFILYLLRLGKVAVQLSHYADASTHFALCLKLLRDRRVQLPLARIRAHAWLAMTYGQRGLCTVALHHYEEARRLCAYYDEEDELADIYYGLSEVYRRQGKLIDAYTAGQEALHRYQLQAKEVRQSQMYLLLGAIAAQLGYTESANKHYMQSLRLAQEHQKSIIIMLNYADLAELRLKQEQPEEARSYSKQALEYARRVDAPHMSGGVYIVVMKVMLELAKGMDETKRKMTYENALILCQEAEERLKETQAYEELTELYGHWAQILEFLGREREAVACWRSAYTATEKAKL